MEKVKILYSSAQDGIGRLCWEKIFDSRRLDNLSSRRINYLESQLLSHIKVMIWRTYLLDYFRHTCVN